MNTAWMPYLPSQDKTNNVWVQRSLNSVMITVLSVCLSLTGIVIYSHLNRHRRKEDSDTNDLHVVCMGYGRFVF